VRDGDDYVINGSKIWTTHAHFSNRIFCLVRTRYEGKPQTGITFLLFDLDLPGVEIRPIISISGEHEVNQVFFTDVRVPVACRLGEENDGWTVAKYLLQHERSHHWSPLLRVRLNRIRQRAASAPAGRAGLLIDDPLFAAKLARLEIELSVFEVGEFRGMAAVTGHGPLPGGVASMMKVLGTELRQRIDELAIEVEGASATAVRVGGPEPGSIAMRTYLDDRAASIYAGANEVQRNIVAAAILR